MAKKDERTEKPGTEVPGGQPPPGDTGRRERVAVAAYYNAERRGFQQGGETDDWLEAERQIDGAGPEKGHKAAASVRATERAAGAGQNAGDRPDFPDLNEAGIEHIEPEEVKKWAERLNVPAPRLREAIKRVGPLVRDVKQFLQDPASR
jgi:hypothetical protein